MIRQRLFSSREIIRALERAGFAHARSAGSHASYTRPKPDGSGHHVVVVPLDKPEVPRGTFESILEQAHLSYDESLALARVKRQG